MTRTTRRELLQASAAATLGSWLPFGNGSLAWGRNNLRDKRPVAAVVTEYRPNSHADVIVGKILEGFRQDGGQGPDLRLVSLYADQVPTSDISRALADKHGFRLAKTIDEAITLGTDQVQVAGVLSIGEHGHYPTTVETKQLMYPRRRFFDEIVASFRRCGKSVPVFNDKHLAYRWEDASFMFDTARELKFPLLAGSSLPVAWREPTVELPRDCEIESAISIGYGGLEAYGFHALEMHQCMIERRRGGEVGVASVQAVTGDGIREAEAQGRWSGELFLAALKQMPGELKNTGAWVNHESSAAFLLQHQDGMKSAVLMANGLAAHFAFAVKLKGHPEPIATWFKLEESPPFGHFAYLVRAIDSMIQTGRAPWPVERTLLTTGILDRVMQSLAQSGKRIDTPELNISYAAADWPFANRPVHDR
jgi:hypothetical protein